MSFKVGRVEEDIKRQISLLIMNMKNMSLASKEIYVVKVKMAENCLRARVYIRSLKGVIYAKQAISLLNRAIGFLKHEISKNLGLKKVPNLEFLADDSLEYEEHLEELFSKIKKEKLNNKYGN